MLLKTSDSVINSHRKVPSKRTGNLPLEVLNLIVPPLIPAHQAASKILCDDEDYLGSDSLNFLNDNDSSDDNC